MAYNKYVCCSIVIGRPASLNASLGHLHCAHRGPSQPLRRNMQFPAVSLLDGALLTGQSASRKAQKYVFSQQDLISFRPSLDVVSITATPTREMDREIQMYAKF